VGILGTLRHLCFGDNRSTAQAERINRNFKANGHGARRCQIEELEPRRLFAVDVAPHVLLGSTYFESDSGDDSHPDTLQVTYVGGAPGTTLNRLTINGDKRQDGLTDGDVFFDTAAGGLGAFHFNGLSIASADGFTVKDAIVQDGGSLITFDFEGFKAGDKLVFTIDADEAQYVAGTTVDTNSLVEGGEFQRSILIGQFSAPGFVDLSLQALYWDDFDTNFSNEYTATGETLDLPNDAYTSDHDYSDRTAGAIADAAQIPLATISGWVYHDRSDDGVFNTGPEEGIGGVTVELLDANGNGTGITTTTSTDPSKLGFYEFRNLVPGTYGVREVQPSGWLDGKDTAGDHGGTAAPEPVGTIADKITGAALNYGDHGLNYNFGELLPSSISGRVHSDPGADCDFDNPNNKWLKDVTIDLLDGNGNLVATTKTDANGEYHFTGLRKGNYIVREHQPTEYYDGGERVGTVGGSSHDELPLYSIFTGIALPSGIDAIQYDFCEKVGVNLEGNVYHDRDDDGNFDKPGEEGIAGVTLKLIDGNGNDTGLRATTDANGHYVFTHLAAGAYTVIEVQPGGWLDGKDTPGNSGGVADTAVGADKISGVTLAWGVNGVEYNFGELLPGSIAGRVHADPGADCDFDNPDNNWLQGVQIDLLDPNGKVLATTYTDKDGKYEFDGLRPGTYSVREHQPTQYFDGGERVGTAGGVSSDVAGLYSLFTGIQLGSDVDAIQYDFCEKPPSSIEGRVHADIGPDCDFDNPDNHWLQGVTIDLLDGDGKVIATTQTDANGEYKFTGLPKGDYTVREHQPTEYYDGGERVGSVGGNSYDDLPAYSIITAIALPYGTDAIHYDFCEKPGVMLSGYVYHDRSNDGVFNRPGEEGIPNVTLKLIDGNGHDTGLRATTDSTGFYKFTNLAAGTYSVIEVQPAGWLDGIDTPGSLGGVADTSPGGDTLSQITLNWGVNGVEYNFGEILPASIAGRVHADPGSDCDFDNPNNNWLGGVQIDLLDTEGTVLATTFTDSQGKYLFDGLAPGVYTVREHQPTQYFDGGERVGTSGGTSSDVKGVFSIFTGIGIGSGVHAIQYDFCEKPGADLSGYVFIDEPTILFAGDDPPTVEQIAAERDGTRTPNDTPLAGVTVELRNGETGEPILVGDAIPGSYSGLPTDPIRVVTDANGYYHFGGLNAGLYAVVEFQPDGVTDNVDTPGTTGGFAANPVGIWTSHTSNPTVSQQAIIDQFRGSYGSDAITLIPLQHGDNSIENNFSEVVVQPEPPHTPPPPVPPPETPPPPEKPRVFPPLALQQPPFLWAPQIWTPNIPSVISSSDDVGGYTWHLSVVNAGWPRSMATSAATFQLTASQMDVANWQSIPLDRATWTLAILDGSRVVVERTAVLGNEKAIPVTGDFNGDGVTDIGVYIDGQWFLDLNGNGRWDEGDLWAKLGTENDLPITGDWDADGKTDIGIYGPAWNRDPWAISREPGLPDADNFANNSPRKFKNMPPKPEDATDGARMLRRTARGKSRADLIDHVFHYGEPGDVPLSGDWNGDGVKQIGVFHDGQWYLDLDGDGKFTEKDAAFVFGQAGDIPVVGDFNGDGVDVVGVYRSGKWFIDSNNNHRIDAADKVFELGGAGDKPVVGDWNDDGKDDPGVYHPGPAANRVAKRAG
jgi:serine-aspartate repeat-containing protein C/D/E